jgi:hypothetical protein
MLSQARAILRHSTELAQDVLHRGEHFDVALKKVQAETQNRRGHDAQMADLRTHAPDADPLAELTEADLNGLIDAAAAVNAMMGETP